MESLHEEWRPVKDCEGQYEVSSLGRVRSPARTVVRGGKVHNLKTRIFLCNVSSNSGPGYPVVRLNGRTIYVHQLVLETFVGPRPPRHEACHCNGIRTDNRAVNLRWDTPSANQNDRVTHGTSNRGERCGTAKLTESQVVEILRSPERGCEIAKRFGISQQAVCNIRKRRIWSHINA